MRPSRRYTHTRRMAGGGSGAFAGQKELALLTEIQSKAAAERRAAKLAAPPKPDRLRTKLSYPCGQQKHWNCTAKKCECECHGGIRIGER